MLIGVVALFSLATLVNCQKEVIEDREEIEEGSQIHRGTSIPSDSDYNIGDYYFNEKTSEIYGPKTAEGWGSPIKFGKEQTDNSRIHSGTGAPELTTGTEGDWYIDLDTKKLYGPKTQNNWGAGIVLGGSSFSGTNQDPDATLPNYLLSDDGLELLVWANAKSQVVDMTKDKALQRVEKISEEAFSRKRALTKIILGENVAEIGTTAFEQDYFLKTVEFNPSNNLRIIGEEAFFRCINLKEMILPQGLTALAKMAFNECEKLEKVVVPSTCADVGNGAFFACKELKEVTFEDGVQRIFGDVFQKCTVLEKVTFPKSLNRIGTSLFKESGVKEVTFLGEPALNVDESGEISLHLTFAESAVERILVPSQHLEKYQEALRGTIYEPMLQVIK
ncbi:MAG: leucine-rich repeat domain-containing protein [Capnocytophaga sp.]|nr:leucine-rich repeat domain-containing protein [Capnocytophaga sp.]